MKKHTTFLLASALAVLAACGGVEDKSADKQVMTEPKAAPEVCDYSHGSDAPEVAWIAYKYSEKTGVRGVFDEVELRNTGSGNSPADVLVGSELIISTASSNSGDPTRDPKILESFFGKLTDGETITGRVAKAEGDGASGNLSIDITMNGMTKPTPAAYTITEDKLEIKLELNVQTWEAMPALNALNKVCEDLHKGADGKSVLWPDVTVYVTTSLLKNCDPAV